MILKLNFSVLLPGLISKENAIIKIVNQIKTDMLEMFGFKEALAIFNWEKLNVSINVQVANKKYKEVL